VDVVVVLMMIRKVSSITLGVPTDLSVQNLALR